MPSVKLTRRKKKVRTRPARARARKAEQEIGFIGKALRGLGGLGGSTLGAMIGQPSAGASVGSSLGAALSRWLGAGDYEVSKNTLVSRAASSIPMMHKTNQSVVIRHREYVGPINGSTDYNLQYQLTINPGMIATFPWLSKIARCFQEYEVRGMVFHYIPTSGSAVSSTSAALGSVMIQTSYRSGDTPPQSKVGLLNEYWSNEVVPCETMAHPIECDPKENPFSVHYVRSGPIPSGEPLLYDIGTTFVATQGMQSSYQVGDLWVTYEIELKKPIVLSNVTSDLLYYGAIYTSVSSTSFFGGTPTNQTGNLPTTFSGRTITIPKPLTGYFTMYFAIVSTAGLTGSTATTWTGSATLTNCALSSQYLDGNNVSLETNNTATNVVSKSLFYALSVVKTDNSVDATVLLPSASWTSGSTLYISVHITSVGLG